MYKNYKKTCGCVSLTDNCFHRACSLKRVGRTVHLLNSERAAFPLTLSCLVAFSPQSSPLISNLLIPTGSFAPNKIREGDPMLRA